MFDFQPRTIHFGLSHFLPISDLSFEKIGLFESSIQKKGLQIIGKVSPNIGSIQLNCKTSEDAIFNIKLEKVGEIRTAEKEPVYALTLISGEDGNHSSLPQIYSIMLDSLPDSVSISGLSIRREATLRKLYGPVPNQHAFQFLWENVLSQQGEVLKVFQGIMGGGLHIVPMPKQTAFVSSANGVEIVQIEFKVESFLRDPRYLFVEGVYVWPEPFHFHNISTIKESLTSRCEFVTKDVADTIETFIRSLSK